MTDLEIGKYAWLTDADAIALSEAGCITCATGGSVDDVLNAFGAVRDEPIELVSGDIPDVEAVAVVSVGDVVVAVEFNGYQGSRPEVLKPASAAGSSASVFWNINGHIHFASASRRRLTADVDLVLDDDPEGLPKQLRGLMSLTEDEDADLVAIGMAMVERYTGFGGLTSDVVNNLTRAYAVSPPVEDLYQQTARWTSLRYDHEALVDRIAEASPQLQREIAEVAAGAAIESVGLDQDPRARSVLDQFDRSSPATSGRTRQ